MAISDPPFSIPVADGGPDDLPRTLRREREAREREAREREAREARERAKAAPADYRAFAPGMCEGPAVCSSVVSRLDIPFFHLMAFFLKAVFAALPALMVLAVLLWGAAHVLLSWFPDLAKMQILILFPPG